MEIYRSRDGRWSIERHLDRYLIYDGDDEVWSCRTIDEVYDWLRRNGLSVADFDEA